MDLTETIAPRSDQQNFDDVAAVSRTLTITEVKQGSTEQPVEVHNAEFPGRPYKPSKSMRRVLVAAWGPDTTTYVGRRLTIYGDPTVKFGGSTVGGIKISHLSHIDKRLTLALTVTRGKRKAHIVEPLPDAAPTPTELSAEQVAASTDITALGDAWRVSGPELRAQIEARVAELRAAPTGLIEGDDENYGGDSPDGNADS